MPKTKTVINEALAVPAASHARINFDVASPQGGQLAIDHLRAEQPLARECRPLASGARSLDIKTHPAASHIACSILVNGRAINGVRFKIDFGERIEATARHFIIIGAMKAGTTTLFELMAQHPALCRTWAQTPGVSFTKEINYFSHLYRKGDSPLHYDWRFPFDPDTHAWTLDVSPNYAKWPASKGVPARIASLGGDAKLAYILREPIDRIESHLAHTLRVGGEITNLAHSIRTSRYAFQLDQFAAHFARDDILLLDFEQLQRDPTLILAQIFDFLSIDRFAVRTQVHNSRSIDFHLDSGQRVELANALRSDIRRLVNIYGFSPAEKWLQSFS